MELKARERIMKITGGPTWKIATSTVTRIFRRKSAKLIVTVFGVGTVRVCTICGETATTTNHRR